MLTTKSIRLTEEGLADLHEYLEVTGDIEAVALERAALLGIRELRLTEAIRVYLKERDSAHGARIAGIPRAQFLQILAERASVFWKVRPVWRPRWKAWLAGFGTDG